MLYCFCQCDTCSRLTAGSKRHVNHLPSMNINMFLIYVERMNVVYVIVTIFVGFPSLCPLGSRYLSQWIKQLELKADHFHRVLRLRIRGNFPSLPLYSFVALCFGTGTPLLFSIIISNHRCDQVVPFLPKVNCGEKMIRLIFLLIIVFWM